MLGKIAIAAAVVICAAVPLSQVDYHALYNEMYPVNGLKRDVLGLCTQAKPTFVRALETDRVNCYDSMPDKLDLAIGWVRTTDRLAANKPPTAVQLAERLLAEVAARRRLGFAGPPQFTGYVVPSAAARPCEAAALASVAAGANNPLTEPNERLARRLAKGDDPALAALGLVRPGTRNASQDQALPVLPLAGSRQAALSGGGSPSSLVDPTAPPNLGDSVPAQATSGCGTRA